MKRLLISSLAVGVLLSGIAPAKAAEPDLVTIIDDFSFANPNPTIVSLTGASNPAVVNNNASTYTRLANAPVTIGRNPFILGGERELYFTRTFANARSRSGSVTIDPDALGTTSGNIGTLSIDNGTGFNSRTRLIWNGIGNAGLNADLSERGYFQLEIEAIDLSTSLALTVTDNLGRTSTVTKANTQPGLINYFFKEFSNIDFNSVRSIQLDITGTQAFDAEINLISAQTIPEPSVVLGLSFVAGLGFLARRKNAHN